MATAHIESLKEDIAPIVLMPGDPLRAKYIADNFLTNVRIVNKIRGMLAYTGYYNNKRVTIFPSGMGIPSMGIYAYELYKFYDVEKIIRIGTCGTINKNIKLLDVILADNAYSLSSFPQLFDLDTGKSYAGSKELNQKISLTASRMNINIKNGEIITSDVFDPYVDHEKFISNFPTKDFIASEMEAFALFYLAHKLDKEASCLLTVVDSKYDNRSLTSNEREKSLNNMIKLALNAICL